MSITPPTFSVDDLSFFDPSKDPRYVENGAGTGQYILKPSGMGDYEGVGSSYTAGYGFVSPEVANKYGQWGEMSPTSNNYRTFYDPNNPDQFEMLLKTDDKEGTKIVYKKVGDQWVPTIQGTQAWDTNTAAEERWKIGSILAGAAGGAINEANQIANAFSLSDAVYGASQFPYGEVGNAVSSAAAGAGAGTEVLGAADGLANAFNAVEPISNIPNLDFPNLEQLFDPYSNLFNTDGVTSLNGISGLADLPPELLGGVDVLSQFGGVPELGALSADAFLNGGSISSWTPNVPPVPPTSPSSPGTTKPPAIPSAPGSGTPGKGLNISDIIKALGGGISADRNEEFGDRMMALYNDQLGRYMDYYGKLKTSYDNPESYWQGAEGQALRRVAENKMGRLDSNTFTNQADYNKNMQDWAAGTIANYRSGLEKAMSSTDPYRYATAYGLGASAEKNALNPLAAFGNYTDDQWKELFGDVWETGKDIFNWLFGDK